MKKGREEVDGRRDFLRRAAMMAGLPGMLISQSVPRGMITRERDPENLEFPFDSLDSFLTPNESFYIRSHFQKPQIDMSAYRLRVEGAVDRPFEIGLDELRKLSKTTVTATLECAGNGRVLLIPQVPGAQWELGAVSNAEWTGVPLSALLERAGVHTTAMEVVLEGADKGEPKNDPKPPGGTPYARSIPLGKARRPEVLIAFGMNGQDLPASHGAPVRAVVPGYYGMSSVKWLTRIHVVNEPFSGYWQTTDYAYWDRSGSIPVRRPLRDMQVKSQIARPTLRETLRSNTSYRVSGAAWTGDSDISKVELSTDGGKTWVDTKFIDQPLRFAWRRWEWDWRVPAGTGKYTLMSRASDSGGNAQPSQHNRDTGGYAIRHIVPREIEVK